MLQVSSDLTSLEEFLLLPEFKPAFEYIGGRVIQKMSPMFPHSVIQTELCSRLNGFAHPRKLGRALTELRGVFGGASQVPDISFLIMEHVPKYTRGEEPTNSLIAPDISVEIFSPGQKMAELRAKIRHALKHGTKLGWLIHPTREFVEVHRPGRKVEVLRVGDMLLGEDVLPGFALPVDEMFGWLDQD